MPDDLYWRSTPAELGTLLEQITKRRNEEVESSILNSGLGAAATYNVHRKRGARFLKPSDFLGKPKKDKTVMLPPAAFISELKAFAKQHNRQERVRVKVQAVLEEEAAA